MKDDIKRLIIKLEKQRKNNINMSNVLHFSDCGRQIHVCKANMLAEIINDLNNIII